MEYAHLHRLREYHSGLRLLAAEHLPLLASFLHRAFLIPNARSVSASELERQLGDYLSVLNEGGDDTPPFPRRPREYLDDWSRGQAPLLRKFYPEGSDEPSFDLMPTTEQALSWLSSLGRWEFVGTESRLQIVFDLLREITFATEPDAARRIAELERRKAELDAEIGRMCAGSAGQADATWIRERFLQAEDTARRLLADFRQVEENFRALDRETRERIATTTQVKGHVLDQIFAEHDAIRHSDQGRSFRAFWELLMSESRRSELIAMLTRIYALPEVQTLSADEFLRRIYAYLLDAGQQVERTGQRLSEQLRRFLDDRLYRENRRVAELIASIEQRAVALKDRCPPDGFVFLPGLALDIETSYSRPLFVAPKPDRVLGAIITEGSASELSADALYQQIYVDPRELQENIRRMLQARTQVSLREVLETFPIRRGVAELVCYLKLASEAEHSIVDDAIEETLSYERPDGSWRQVDLPRVIFLHAAAT